MMQLLESKPQKRQKTVGGTVFSIVFHAALLFFAIYATARAGVSKNNEKREQKVSFVEMRKEPPPPVKKDEPPPPPKAKKPPPVTEHNPKPLPPAPMVDIAPPKGFKVLDAPVNVPVELPKIDLSAKVTNEGDFSGKGVAGGSASGKEGGTAGGTGTKEAVPTDHPYTEFQVEQQVQAISGTHVDYPESLRTTGVEGEVQAQFVVNEQGRAEPGTFKVLNSANGAFTDAVRRALSGMRFRAAQIGGQKVSQIVQQTFIFKLNK
jgi:periplasmic protein TonB